METEVWITKHEAELIDVSRKLWEHPEPALTEQYASSYLSNLLAENGFAVVRGLGGMETAFSATFGNGMPRIALLGEYDALSGMSQSAESHEKAETPGAAGHGCGHNLLGTAPLGAVLALQQRMREKNLPGTIVYFGCPAEEIMTGKIRMAAAGCFDGFDAALAWHPWPCNMVMTQNMLAMNTAKFTFYGTPSHAAAAPEKGRSALDAIELMNVGVNYLREHVPSDVRIHYSITNGGSEPNIVPPIAQSWYYVRAPLRQSVDETFDRICNIARGAALMTDTRAEIELITGCWHLLQNAPMNRLLQECMEVTPRQSWSEEEETFATEMMGKPGTLPTSIVPLTQHSGLVFGSTDVADVSWIVPTAQFAACTAPMGTSCHTWQFCASAGMSIGQKGMLYAAKVLALAGERLLTDKQLRAEILADYRKEKGDTVYRTVVKKTFS